MPEPRHWGERRAEALDRLRRGETFGYLAYVDGRPAAWANASRRSDCSLYRRGGDADERTVCVACFVVAPPYRGHGLQRRLLDRILGDARRRGAEVVEAYPLNHDEETGFRGRRVLYEGAGFTEVKVRTFDTVMRRDA